MIHIISFDTDSCESRKPLNACSNALCATKEAVALPCAGRRKGRVNQATQNLPT